MRPHARQNNGAGVQTEVHRLREQVRALQMECKALEKEKDGYVRALLAKFRQENSNDDWSDFDPVDYKDTLEDILTDFEKEHGPCLPRKHRFTSPTPSQSGKRPFWDRL